jgi:hypothetical protein
MKKSKRTSIVSTIVKRHHRRITGEELQKRRNLKPVWVAQVLWSDGYWGPFPEMGCSSRKDLAMALASKFIKENRMTWASGTRTSFGFSQRIRFRKYWLCGNVV